MTGGFCVRSDTEPANFPPTFVFPTIYGASRHKQNASVSVPRDLFHAGDVVRKLRDQKGWTQPQLAKRAKVGYTTVVDFERDPARARPQTRQKLARALGLDPDDLNTPFIVQSAYAASAGPADRIPTATGVSEPTQKGVQPRATPQETVQRSLAEPTSAVPVSPRGAGEQGGQPPLSAEEAAVYDFAARLQMVLDEFGGDRVLFERWWKRAIGMVDEMKAHDQVRPQAAGGDPPPT